MDQVVFCMISSHMHERRQEKWHRSRAKLTLFLLPFFLCLLEEFLPINFSHFYPNLASISQSTWSGTVQFSHSVISDFTTPWAAACQAYLSITNSRSMLKVMSIELVMPSNHLVLCHPLLLLPSIFPSIRVFANDSVLSIRWPKYWNSASSSVHSMNIQDWFPLGLTDMISLQSKGLSRVFQSSKASILWFLTFLIVQLSHPYVTTGKTIALTR